MSKTKANQRAHLTAADRAVAAQEVANIAGHMGDAGEYDHLTPSQRKAVRMLIESLRSRARRLRGGR